MVSFTAQRLCYCGGVIYQFYDRRTFFMSIPRVLVITRRTNNRLGIDEFQMKIGHSLWTNLGHNLCSNSELNKFNTNTGNPRKEKSYKSAVSYRFHCYKNKYFIPSCNSRKHILYFIFPECTLFYDRCTRLTHLIRRIVLTPIIISYTTLL